MVVSWRRASWEGDHWSLGISGVATGKFVQQQSPEVTSHSMLEAFNFLTVTESVSVREVAH